MQLNRRRRLDPCDVFSLNQAAAEIFFMLFAPFHILLNVRPEMWFYKPLGLFLGSGMSVRSLLQCAMCLECYNTPIAVLFVTLHTLPSEVFNLSSDVCLAINLAMGCVQALFVLRKFL
ncbi:hypothetical protein Q7C36_005279 [Tachysurus vachellii]|uniref:Uncharacterized protein n=1 Tax=Tachysurus vachellii TaxID=175792 RepID=A0AA88NIP1_TACVA|nr:hypothetical protein Q7C36_005279 [Tachysurus vachellii]